jgi:hypothetical protein
MRSVHSTDLNKCSKLTTPKTNSGTATQTASRPTLFKGFKLHAPGSAVYGDPSLQVAIDHFPGQLILPGDKVYREIRNETGVR